MGFFQNAGVLGGAMLFSVAFEAVADEKPNYNFEIKPILAEHCLKCHGQDEKKRKAKLRLDDRESAIATKSIIPGKPEESEMIKHLLSHDPEEVMPPPKENRPVSEAQVALLKRWIEQGADYQKHWSFMPLEKTPVPSPVKNSGWINNPIDAFVLSHLEKANLTPARVAESEAWLRRVTFDLTGLPPTLEELDAFRTDTASGAHEKVVGRLLASSAYGERMAVEWLDVARFADTYGRHEDHDSLTWPYRDWVIRAFNNNLPYDKFVRWQTAGDMMPGATQDMYLATAFNRLPQQSNEAGSNEEEFRQDIIADRVRTNSIAFLGLSMECARCHDHKYDPISTRDYYSFSAFLNNIDECGLYTVYTDNIPAPSMFVYDGDDERLHAEVKLKIALKEQQRAAMVDEARKRFEAWLPTASVIPAKPVVYLPFESIGDKTLENKADPTKPGKLRLKAKLTDGAIGKSLQFTGDNTVTIAGAGKRSRTQPFSMSLWINLEKPTERAVVAHNSRAGMDAGSMGYELLLEDNKPSFALCHFWPGNAMRVRAIKPVPAHQWTHITVTYDGSSKAAGMKIYINGAPAEQEVVRDNLYKDIAYNNAYMGKDSVESASLALAGRHNDTTLTNAMVDEFKFFECDLSAAEVRLDAGINTKTVPQEWFQWWLREVDESWKKVSAELQALRAEEAAIAEKMKEVMVMREMPGERRPTHVLTRGHFLAKAAMVGPDTPSNVFAFPADLPRNRLGLAQWLTDPKNPLTSRVFVNRVWQMFFGRGIVGTSEDFGVQGQLPSHPQLLDWLALSFMDSGWDIKALCKLITLSNTYRQSSIPAKLEMLKDDPDNKLLSRGPRMRLTAEQLRDNALAISGLLNRRLSGEPVMPYQPAGLWEDSGTQHSYTQSKGADLYRRSLYTFWRRTLPPPSMSVFDAPTREFCKTRRDKSSSPMQALVLFNDPQFLEAARVLAENLVRETPGDDVARVKKAYRLSTSLDADEWQTKILAKLLQEQRAHFQSAPKDAESLRRKNGEYPVDEKLSEVEVAATTLLVRALLASDECVMKP